MARRKPGMNPNTRWGNPSVGDPFGEARAVSGTVIPATEPSTSVAKYNRPNWTWGGGGAGGVPPSGTPGIPAASPGTALVPAGNPIRDIPPNPSSFRDMGVRPNPSDPFKAAAEAKTAAARAGSFDSLKGVGNAFKNVAGGVGNAVAPTLKTVGRVAGPGLGAVGLVSDLSNMAHSDTWEDKARNAGRAITSGIGIVNPLLGAGARAVFEGANYLAGKLTDKLTGANDMPVIQGKPVAPGAPKADPNREEEQATVSVEQKKPATPLEAARQSLIDGRQSLIDAMGQDQGITQADRNAGVGFENAMLSLMPQRAALAQAKGNYNTLFNEAKDIDLPMKELGLKAVTANNTVAKQMFDMQKDLRKEGVDVEKDSFTKVVDGKPQLDADAYGKYLQFKSYHDQNGIPYKDAGELVRRFQTHRQVNQIGNKGFQKLEETYQPFNVRQDTAKLSDFGQGGVWGGAVIGRPVLRVRGADGKERVVDRDELPQTPETIGYLNEAATRQGLKR